MGEHHTDIAQEESHLRTMSRMVNPPPPAPSRSPPTPSLPSRARTHTHKPPPPRLPSSPRHPVKEHQGQVRLLSCCAPAAVHHPACTWSKRFTLASMFIMGCYISASPSPLPPLPPIPEPWAPRRSWQCLRPPWRCVSSLVSVWVSTGVHRAGECAAVHSQVVPIAGGEQLAQEHEGEGGVAESLGDDRVPPHGVSPLRQPCCRACLPDLWDVEGSDVRMPVHARRWAGRVCWRCGRRARGT